jgi:hypothetical protein
VSTYQTGCQPCLCGGTRRLIGGTRRLIVEPNFGATIRIANETDLVVHTRGIFYFRQFSFLSTKNEKANQVITFRYFYLIEKFIRFL